MEVVLSFVSGRDVFVALPTGFGKSFCFFVLPRIFDALGSPNSIVLVLSPLLAIMQDQVSFYHSVVYVMMENVVTKQDIAPTL